MSLSGCSGLLSNKIFCLKFASKCYPGASGFFSRRWPISFLACDTGGNKFRGEPSSVCVHEGNRAVLGCNPLATIDSLHRCLLGRAFSSHGHSNIYRMVVQCAVQALLVVARVSTPSESSRKDKTRAPYGARYSSIPLRQVSSILCRSSHGRVDELGLVHAIVFLSQKHFAATASSRSPSHTQMTPPLPVVFRFSCLFPPC